MECIHFEADDPSNYDNTSNSDDEKLMTLSTIQKEIVDNVSLYRKLDPWKREDYYKFPKQTRDPISAAYEDDELFFSETELQPELCMPEGTENAKFDNFSGHEKVVKKFHSSLRNFKESNNSLVDSIIYRLMYNYIRNTLEKDKVGIDKS